MIIIFTSQILLADIDLISYKYQKIISSTVAQLDTNKSNYETVDYYARFNCGTIDDDKGPLRPGKYDSDITIFNKKNFPLTIIWKAIEINQENKDNFKIINIQPESIVNINCAKIFPSTVIEESNLENKFIEGVLLIRINTNNGQLINNLFNNQGSSIIIDKEELGNLVNVDALHTVNTLSDLKKEAFYFKVDFSVKQPDERFKDRYSNNFTAIFQVEPNSIIDPIELIKHVLNNNQTNNQYMSNNTTIKIINSETFSNSYTDNHALTVQKINPDFK
ncbi:MAG: hypothetical protein H0X03_03750 [Nitrosopumilus sp.]|nr:hypothetical protein [Nitrosopumilus sp.]